MKNLIKGYEIVIANRGNDATYKKENENPIIICTFKNSWGEIDSSISILYAIKKKQEDCRIISVIESAEMMKQNIIVPLLFSKLQDISDVFVYPSMLAESSRQNDYTTNKLFVKIMGYYIFYKNNIRTFVRGIITKANLIWRIYQFLQDLMVARKWSFFIHLVNQDRVEILLEDRTKQTKLQLLLRKKFKNAKVVLFPHATALYLKERITDKYLVQKAAEALLVYSDLGLEWAKYSYPNVREFMVTGFPRYDQWWKDALLNDEAFIMSNEYKISMQFEKVILLLSQSVRPSVLDYNVIDYIIKSVADVAMSFNDSLLIIKPHPRQKIEEIQSIMKSFPKDRWLITGIQAIQASMLANIVVSTASSAMLDALSVGKPVIDFFPINPDLCVYFSEEGNGLSEFSYLKLTYHLNTKEEFESVIRDYYEGRNKDIWEQQKETAKRILMLDNKSSERAASVICGLLEKNRNV